MARRDQQKYFMRQILNQMRNGKWIAAIAAVTLLLGGTEAFANEEKAMRQFFNDYCVKCHGPEKQKSGLRLDQLDAEIKNSASVVAWQDVLDVLNTGEMPPEDEKQPEAADLTSVIGVITDNILSARKRLAATGGVIKMRHLNKREYLGSMKDLFGVDLPPSIVPDDASEAFDTIGADQFFSLKQFEGYYKAGLGIVEKNLAALTAPLPKSGTIRHDPEIAPFQAAKAAYETMVKTKELIDAGAPISEISKVDPKIGDAGQVRLFINRYPVRSKKPIANYENLKGKKGVSGGFVHTFDSRPRSLYKVAISAIETAGGEVDIAVNNKSVGSVQFKPGKDQVSSKLTLGASILDSTITLRVSGRKNDVYDCLTLTGPFEDNLSEPSFFESVVKPAVQSGHPSEGEIAAMLRKFADRAFRYQGVDEEYIAELVNVYNIERSNGKNVGESLVQPLTAIITSPAFLYIKEPSDGSKRLLGQREFAIRMAYFLWGAPPDQELHGLAKSGALFDKAVMKAQFERMLASPKADVFLADFINQWSDIDRFDEIDLPVKLIRGGFQASARRELSEFFKVLVREDRPLDNLIDSDFVVVDATLAQYYGLNGRAIDGFQKVALPASSPRGGMLSQAAFLVTGGSGPRTSPTIRGAIIREKFLHDPVPPPPPNVPAIEHAKGQKLTVKQQVDRHKAIPQCASCHNKIDPIGYGLENFDYLGNWRMTETPGGETPAGQKTKKRGKRDKADSKPVKVAIDASGRLEGERFEGFEGLQQALLQNKDRLARSMYESLLSYGIGREIEFVDDPEVDDRLTGLKSRNYPLKDMIFEVVASRAFATK